MGLELLIFAGALIVLDVLVVVAGADTRDADDWVNHRPL